MGRSGLPVRRGTARTAPTPSPRRGASKVGPRFLISLFAVPLIPQLPHWRPSALDIILLFSVRSSAQLSPRRVAACSTLAWTSLKLGAERLGALPASPLPLLRLALRAGGLSDFEPFPCVFAVRAELLRGVGGARRRWACLGRRARGAELGRLWGQGAAQCSGWVQACDCAPFSVSLWRFL